MGIRLGNTAVCLVKSGFARIPEQYIASGWDLWGH